MKTDRHHQFKLSCSQLSNNFLAESLTAMSQNSDASSANICLSLMLGLCLAFSMAPLSLPLLAAQQCRTHGCGLGFEGTFHRCLEWPRHPMFIFNALPQAPSYSWALSGCVYGGGGCAQSYQGQQASLVNSWWTLPKPFSLPSNGLAVFANDLLQFPQKF